MLYRIWCSSKWYHSRSIWMGIFQPRKLELSTFTHFFQTIAVEDQNFKMVENYVWLYRILIDDFDWRFSIEWFWLTILIDNFWLTILIDDFWLTIFDWRFWLTIFNWRFWLTILIDDFWLTILIDDFWLTIFDWRFWLTILIDDFGLTIFDWIFQPRKLNSVLLLTFFKRSQLKIRTVKMVENYVCCTEFDALQNDTTLDQFEWEFSNLESWTQYFYSLFSNDRSWRSEQSKWLKIMYVVQNLMLFKMIPLSINLNGNFPT